ncbi:hypothetical protein BDQ94DRAFT_59139 [Aspergillus welwitschiae]|uniref:Uncharacterized protein n=1 Tax=Aspergillus welwitschiae TaxID=1341132 RepID=A0A3F3PZ04_9EURO|nr:hypothetical protein BDQ94DRAFT_59139 [Aspergillus welwitschiae]RDH31606.1 hypothetical protein BDQ94DRAFT_59139 [Aspergillus welwitschiae]
MVSTNTSIGLPSINSASIERFNPSQLSHGHGMQTVSPINAERSSSTAGYIAYNHLVCTVISDAPVCHPYNTSIQMSLVPASPRFAYARYWGRHRRAWSLGHQQCLSCPSSILLQPSMTFLLFMCCYPFPLRITITLCFKALRCWQKFHYRC